MSIALWVFRLSGHYKNIYSYRLKKTRWYFYVPDLRQIKSSVRPSVHPSVRPSVCLSVPLLSRWYLQKYKRYQLDAKVQLRALFTFFDITLALSQIIKTFESMFVLTAAINLSEIEVLLLKVIIQWWQCYVDLYITQMSAVVKQHKDV